MNKYNEDIFIIDCWIDNESKENDLINLIKFLKQFNAPILVGTHKPLKQEIQEMVDYYLYDKNNPILLMDDFNEYGCNNAFWTKTNDWDSEVKYEYHHDYAIWTTMQNAFKFANLLGKKYIHFLEYDNLPNQKQYEDAFLAPIRDHDAVLYEYIKNSTKDVKNGEFCATYIFSIKTNVALNLINKINTKEEFFKNRPKGWQLEKVFMSELKKVTSNFIVSKYIPNDNELNTQAVWNRDGILRNNAKFRVFLVVDEFLNLYCEFISGFHDDPANEDYFVEITYSDTTKFHEIKKDTYTIVDIGRYKKGGRVKIYYKGIEVFNEFLDKDYNTFRTLKKINFYNQKVEPKLINVHFVDGPFIEVLDDVNKRYFVEFIDNKTQTTFHSQYIDSNNWCRPSKKFFVNWKVKLSNEKYHFEHIFDATNRNVLISFESKSIGDTIGWFPYAEEFRKKHNCNVICSTFHNYLFQDQYPNIKFVKPGTVVNDLYALYRIGYMMTDNRKGYNSNYHFADPKIRPLQMVASDMLGLDYTEIKPLLKSFKPPKKRQVAIGIHSTTQAKYWNNPTGWQEVVDYLKSRNYEVVSLSKEENGYMGNFFPKGVKEIHLDDLLAVSKIIEESELFIGISSGLSWISWALNVPTILISGFTDDILEPQNGIHRVINKKVCYGCWDREILDMGDWNWCPNHKNTERMFECSKSITGSDVIKEIKSIIGE